MAEAKTLSARKQNEAPLFQFKGFQKGGGGDCNLDITSFEYVTSRLMMKVVWLLVWDMHNQVVIRHSLLSLIPSVSPRTRTESR